MRKTDRLSWLAPAASCLVEGGLGLTVLFLQRLGQRKAGVNHHLKARRMQWLSRVIQPYQTFWLLLFLGLTLWLVWLFWRAARISQNSRSNPSAAFWLLGGSSVLAWLFLLALSLGFLQQSLLAYAYLCGALWLLLPGQLMLMNIWIWRIKNE